MAAPIYSDPIYSEPTIENRPPGDLKAGLFLLETLRSNPPGQSLEDRFEQSRHHTGVPYIAIEAIMKAMAGASMCVTRRKKNRGRSTFGPGGHVAKAMPTPGANTQDEAYVPATDNPISKVIERPNPNEQIGDILSYMTLQDGLTGIAPVWFLPNKGGRCVEMYALPAALTTPLYQRTPQYPDGAWRVQPFYAGGGLAFLPAPYMGYGAIIPNGELSRMVRPHPYLKWDGYSPLKAGSDQVDILEAIDQSFWSAIEHGITPDMAILLPGQDAGAIDRFEQRLNEKHAGSRNHRKLLVIGGGDPSAKLDLRPMNTSVKDGDYPQSREAYTKYVLALFGVPASVAGLVTATSYSELYAALKTYYLCTLGPHARRLAEFFAHRLCGPVNRFPGEYRIQIDLPKLDDPDLMEKQLGLDLQYDTILYNEARALRNRPPVPGGDLPISVYIDLAKKAFGPKQPEPKPQPPGFSGNPPGDPTQAPPDDVPAADNDASEGTGMPQTKALARFCKSVVRSLPGSNASRHKSVKDAAGHEHDSGSGQFTGTGDSGTAKRKPGSRPAKASKPNPVAEATHAALAKAYVTDPPTASQTAAVFKGAAVMGVAPTIVNGNHPGQPELSASWEGISGRDVNRLEKKLKAVAEPEGYSVSVVRQRDGSHIVYLRMPKVSASEQVANTQAPDAPDSRPGEMLPEDFYAT